MFSLSSTWGSHGNLLANLRTMQVQLGTELPINGVTWLPQYHDMGLICATLFPLSLGHQITLLSPLAFLQKPHRWLEAISHYRPAGTMRRDLVAWPLGRPGLLGRPGAHRRHLRGIR